MSSVKFICRWKIEWSEFDSLSTGDIMKYFITACNNIALLWRVELCTTKLGTETTMFSIFLFYVDGPVDKLKDVSHWVQLMKAGKIIETDETTKSALNRGGSGNGWFNFDVKDATTFQKKHNLLESEPFYYQITLDIPSFIFSFFENLPSPVVNSANWVVPFFENIADQTKSKFWNVKLVSRDGQIFYCHRLVLEGQSDVLAAMFSHPGVDPSKEGEYDFPALSADGLRALLEFLYTGHATLIDIAANEVYELADTAEQYGLKILKQMCLAYFWKRVVEKPECCFDVVRFADLHQDWKYLKGRAMDVLTDKFENLSLHTVDLKERFGGGESGERLRSEFLLYGNRRL